MRRAHGEGSIMRRPRSRYWYASYYDAAGNQVRVSTKEEVKQRALVKLRELMGKSEAGLGGTTRKLHYADLRRALLDDYAAKGNKSSENLVGLRQLDEFVGFKPASDDVPEAVGLPVTRLNTDLARAFTKKRLDEGVGPAMVNRSLACLRRMLRIAFEDGKIRYVPKIRFMKEPPARRGFLERKRFEELLAALPSHLRPYVALMYWTAVRKGEAQMVHWENVDLDARTITLYETKNKDPRIIPIPSPLVDVLRSVEPKTGPVFDTTNLRVHWETACASVGLGTRVEKISEAGNRFWDYDGLLVHDLRRSAARNMRLAGVSETVAMKIGGWKTAAVFRRYNITTSEDLVDAIRAVEVHAAKQVPAVEVRDTLGQQSARRKRLTAGKPRK